MKPEEKIAHLGFIQGTISRVAGNVFLVKGWTVAIVAALTALTSESRVGIYIAIAPAILFWWLDAYYMKQERLFRELYKAVAVENPHIDAFNMDTEIVNGNVKSIFFTMFSGTVWVFYILILVLVAVIATKGIWWDRTERQEKSQASQVATRETYIVLLPQVSQTGTIGGYENLFHQAK